MPMIPFPRRLYVPTAFVLVVMFVQGCADMLGPNDLPSGTQDPANFNSPAGATQAYNKTLSLFQATFVQYIQTSGILSDELRDRDLGNPNADNASPTRNLDARRLPEGVSDEFASSDYTELQRVRGYAAEAIGRLAKYHPTAPPALRGEMYALAAYAELLLAELYCSGVPLSTLDFEKDYTYKPSSTTAQVYEHAIALFDTALTLGADSARVLNLARIGRGRAFMALGRYAEATQAIEGVPDGYVYAYNVAWRGVTTPPAPVFRLGTIADQEGGNGFSYLSSGDPRTKGVPNGKNSFNVSLWFPAKYGSPTATSAVTVADWIEVRLMRAEIALHNREASWLTELNALRTDGTFTTVPNPDNPNVVDTVWNPGTAGVAGLPPLKDPGDSVARVTLVFDERAAWLFVTGHRQGDLRRLIRQYGRQSESVYPTGLYTGGTGLYGREVNVAIPSNERINPLFNGCLDRNA